MRITAARAAMAVAGVYGFFLIFAQFAFVELLRGAGVGLTGEKVALGLMAVAGIAGGFLCAWRGATPCHIRLSLIAAAAAAAVAPMATAFPAALGVALVTGLALGMATVGLAALLPAWCGVAWVGLGTGLGYACCNLPPVFQQSAAGQSWIGAAFALAGGLAVPPASGWPAKENPRIFPMWAAVLVFTALVWMDSAAFFIIQHSEDLKSGTWGEGHLWRNAAVHLLLALAAGAWLLRGGARALPAAAWVLLAVAALAVNHDASRNVAAWTYPAGVSLYSAALVAWPGWFAGAADPRSAAWRAAWLFAIAGWFGSANGIGMAQTLQQVPPTFIAAAGAVVAAVMILNRRESLRPAIAVGVVGVIAVIARGGSTSHTPAPSSAAERGRRVYIAEGCIHCHSRYSRPGSPDESIWGPSHGAEETLKGEPVLIGNRRQGPDLSNIGARRSEAWLKVHFIDPRALAPDSPMPSYAHLFEDGRGDDLVRYLKESGVESLPTLMQTASTWQPTGSPGSPADGKALYAKHCSACHGGLGGGHGPLSFHFTRKPANLLKGPFVWTAAGENPDPHLRIARVIKFGIPGTDMPGHETLTDRDVLSLSDYVLGLRR